MAFFEDFRTALESRRNLEKNLPTCRVCGQPMQPLDEEGQRWYCYYDDQRWFDKEQKWLGEIKDQEQQKQTKYCKKCGNMLELEDEFCDRCGSGQRKSLGPALTNGEQKVFVAKAHTGPTMLWFLVPFFFGIIGGLVGYVAVKDDDKDMSQNLLILGIVMTVVLFFLAMLLL